MKPATEALVDCGGNSIAVRDYGGDGSDLLLLHGNARNLEDWARIAPKLRAHYRVVCMDLRGHGQSSSAAWSFDAVLADVRRVVEHFAMQRPSIAGHSLGGMIAALWAAAEPQTRAAINLDGHGMGQPEQYLGVAPELVHARLAELKALRDAMLSAVPAVPAGHKEELIQQLAAAMSAHGIEAELALALSRRDVHINAEGQAQYGFRATDNAEAIDALNLFDIYERARCPLLVVNCRQIEAMPGAPDWAAEFMHCFRRGLAADLETLTQRHPLVSATDLALSHGLLHEDPQGVADLIHEFIRQQPSGVAR